MIFIHITDKFLSLIKTFPTMGQKLELVQEHTVDDLGVDFETTETIKIPTFID